MDKLISVGLLYSSAWAAITINYRSGGLNSRNLFSHNSRGWGVQDQGSSWSGTLIPPVSGDGSQTWHLEGLRTRGTNAVSPSLSPKAPEPGVSMSKGSRTRMSHLGREQTGPSSAFLSHSGLHWIGWRPLHWWEWSLLNLMQMLISPSNTDTPRNNVLPAIWASLSPVKLHEIVESGLQNHPLVTWKWGYLSSGFCTHSPKVVAMGG